jgi:hypothetical protein
VFGDRLGNEAADSILNALRSTSNGSLARTEVVRLFGGHRRRGEIDAALGLLAELGLVEIETKATGGRPVTRIRLVREERGA